MPARKKLLPRPCPQCGVTYGTCRIVVFNPKWSYTPNLEPRVILSIGHYSPKRYTIPYGEITYTYGPSGPAGFKRRVKSAKIWHNFRLNLWLNHKFKFGFTEMSRTYPLTKKLFDQFKTKGYPTITEKAHFLKRGGLMTCESWYGCHNLVRVSEVKKYGAYFLCDTCYHKITDRKSS